MKKILSLLATFAAAVAFAQPTIPVNNLYPVTANSLVGNIGPAGRAESIPIGTGLAFVNGTLTSNGSGGTVTSVGLSMPSIFSVSGSPLTSSGTISVTGNGTSGGVPYFSSASAFGTSALLANGNVVVGGGSGQPPRTTNVTISGNDLSVPGNATIVGSTTFGNLTTVNLNVTGNFTASGVLDGTLLIGSAISGNFTRNRLTAGDGVTITNGPGTVTINATASGNVSAPSTLTSGDIIIGQGARNVASSSVIQIAGSNTTVNGNLSVTGNISSGNLTAAQVTVADSGGYYTGTNAETVLQEIGGSITALQSVTNPPPTGNQLISGGGVALAPGGGLNVTVSAATYSIQGALYSSPLTNLTLSSADPTNPRIDVVAVDTTGAAVIIQGTPAATPVKPDVDPSTQLELTFFLVPASATDLSVNVVSVYLNNAEWTTTQSGGTINVASTNNPYTGSVCIEGTSVTTNNYVQFVKPASGTFDLADSDNLVFYIRSKASWANNRLMTITVRNSAGTQLGSAVTFDQGYFGFNSAQTTTYQQIIIPTALFAANGQTATTIRMTVGGSGGSIGWYIDDITLQGGVASITDTSRMKWRGNYVASNFYNVNDVVLSSGIQYVAIQAGVGHTPASSATFWQPSSTSTGGTVTTSGTPTSGQAAEFTSATNIQGVATTGSGSYVKATSPTLVTPALGTPSAIVLTNASGLPSTAISDSTSTGRSVLTAADAAAARAAIGAGTGSGSGSVTSVAATVPAFLSISGSPITTSGTLAISYSGTALPVANGGTGTTSLGTGIASFLSSGNLPASALPALTGDITSSAGSAATTLATVNSNVGTFGNATTVPQVTVNAKGLVTAVSNVTISASGNVTNNATLTANRIVLGGGTTVVGVLGSAGTTTTILHGNATGAPAFSAVDLTADVTGTLPVSNGGTGLATLTANAVITGNGTGSVTSVAPGTSGNVLTSNGTAWTSAASGSGSGTVSSGTSGQAAYYTATGTTVGGASGLFYDSANARVGVGTTTPFEKLEVNGATFIKGTANYAGGEGTGLILSYDTGSAVSIVDSWSSGVGRKPMQIKGDYVAIYSNDATPVEAVRASNSKNWLVGTTSDTGLTGAGGLKVGSTTATTTATTGSAIFGGGIGVGGAINATAGIRAGGSAPLVSGEAGLYLNYGSGTSTIYSINNGTAFLPLVIDATKVSITNNTTSPVEALDVVNGAISVRGNANYTAGIGLFMSYDTSTAGGTSILDSFSAGVGRRPMQIKGDYVAIYSNDSTPVETARASNSKNWLIGTTSDTDLTGAGNLKVAGNAFVSNTGWSSGAPYGNVMAVNGNNVNDDNWGHLLVSDSTTTTGHGGRIVFATGSGFSSYNPFAGIRGVSEGTSYGGVAILTRASGGTAAVKATFDSTGNFLLGTTSTTGLTGAGGMSVASTTDATSTSAASAIFAGGLAVAKKLRVGTEFYPSQTNGIVGTTTNNNANAGSVGEYVESLVASGSAVSLTTATAANVTSISLTAGDWDVQGIVNYSTSSATVTGESAGISSTSATLPTDGSEGYSGVQLITTSTTDSITLTRKRMSLSGTTTVYLIGKSTFSVGTVGAFGTINARRVR